jgi:hypothetical protein
MTWGSVTSLTVLWPGSAETTIRATAREAGMGRGRSSAAADMAQASAVSTTRGPPGRRATPAYLSSQTRGSPRLYSMGWITKPFT